MRNLTDELQRAPRLHQDGPPAVPVLEAPADQVQELGAAVLVEREPLGVGLDRDKRGLEAVVGEPHATEELVVLPDSRSSMLELQTLARLHVEQVVLLVEPAE